MRAEYVATRDDIAFTVAAGPWYYHMGARLMADSLRRFAGFTGEIIVLTDRPDGYPKDVLPLPFPNPPLVTTNAKFGKMAIRHAVDLARYRRVWWFDADVIVRRPLTRLITAIDNHDQAVATTEMDDVVTDTGLHAVFLTEDERARWAGEPIVNSGCIGMPGEHATQWLAAWEDEVLAHMHLAKRMLDQPGLNSARLRGRVPLTVVPRQMWYPREDYRRRHADADAPLIHFIRIKANSRQRFAMWCYHHRLCCGSPDPGFRTWCWDRHHTPWMRGRVQVPAKPIRRSRLGGRRQARSGGTVGSSR